MQLLGRTVHLIPESWLSFQGIVDIHAHHTDSLIYAAVQYKMGERRNRPIETLSGRVQPFDPQGLQRRAETLCSSRWESAPMAQIITTARSHGVESPHG